MWTVTNLLLCSFVVVIAPHEVTLKTDRPYLRVQLSGSAALECCCVTNVELLELTWVKHGQDGKILLEAENVTSSDLVTIGERRESDTVCGTLSFKAVGQSDSGLYQCLMKHSDSHLFSHGTYLQVYKPLGRMINLSENTKNRILTAEGILLFLCVLLPAIVLLYQSKRLNALERKREAKEEENIYQGLNLDVDDSTYEQIERSQEHDPYEDVSNVAGEEDMFDLEKP
nr:Cd79a [Ogcocephalus cubifrons]